MLPKHYSEVLKHTFVKIRQLSDPTVLKSSALARALDHAHVFLFLIALAKA